MLGRKLETIAALATVAAMVASMTACGSSNTASNDANTGTQDKPEITIDDSTPSKLLESFAQAVKAEAWDEMPKFFSGEEQPTMAGDMFRNGLMKPAEAQNVGESYTEEDMGGDTDIKADIKWKGAEDEDDFEFVKSPEGGYRIKLEDGTLYKLYYGDGVCAEQALKNHDGEWVLPGKYEVTCPLSWGATAKQTMYFGVDGDDSVEYTKWPSKDKLIQQVTNAITNAFNSDDTELSVKRSNGDDLLHVVGLTSNIDVQDIGVADGDVWVKAVFNFTYTVGSSEQQNTWNDDGTGMWWNVRVSPDGMTMLPVEGGLYKTTALEPTDTPAGYESILSD